MTVICKDYDYAGFRYNIHRLENGEIYADPHPRQHKNAYLNKHCKAAESCYMLDMKQEQKKKREL